MPHGGNVNIMTVMGDARMDGLSDAGSTPARSTDILKFLKESKISGYFFALFCGKSIVKLNESKYQYQKRIEAEKNIWYIY